MGIRPIAYLAATRVAAGVIVAVPLYCVALILGYSAGELITTTYYGQSSGVFVHYFHTFFIPADVLRSFVVTVAEVTTIMLVHTYYGFTASGGPAGVGEAVGARHPRIVDRRRVGDHVRHAGPLRSNRPLQPCGVRPCPHNPDNVDASPRSGWPSCWCWPSAAGSP